MYLNLVNEHSMRERS